MEDWYENFIKAEDEIYRNTKINIPSNISTGNLQLDKCLDWVSEGTKDLLDFGCGSGSFIFYSALRGVSNHIGIDFSSEGIKLSKERAKFMQCGSYKFIVGSVNELKKIENECMDAIILSNIIDNLRPEDCIEVLQQVKRILKRSGKVLIKLNPYVYEEQIKEWNMKMIEEGLFNDGLLLWNQTTDQWRNLISKYLDEEEYIDIFYPEHEMYNRIFLMRK